MPGQLENVPVTSSQFLAALTATFQLPSYKVALSVLNEPVYMQFLQVEPGMRVASGVWREPPEFTPPVIGSVNRPFLIGAVRFALVNPVAPTILPVVSARPG